jgi:hypothetical protein
LQSKLGEVNPLVGFLMKKMVVCVPSMFVLGNYIKCFYVC